MTMLPASFLSVALALVFVHTGTFDFAAIGKLPTPGQGERFDFVAPCRVGQIRSRAFYTWLPEAMVAPTPVSAYLHAAAMVKAGAFLIAPRLLLGFEVEHRHRSPHGHCGRPDDVCRADLLFLQMI